MVLDSDNAFNRAHGFDQAATYGIEKGVTCDDVLDHFLLDLLVQAGEGVQQDTLADDADQPAGRVHDRERGDPVTAHQPGGLSQGRFRAT